MTRVTLTGGRTTWDELVSRREDYTFLWQDLDGLTKAILAAVAPPTTLLHGWSRDGRSLVRVRRVGDVVLEAEISPGGEAPAAVVAPQAWGAHDRTAQFRGRHVSTSDEFAQVDVVDTGDGALTFLVPAALAGAWQ